MPEAEEYLSKVEQKIQFKILKLDLKVSGLPN